VLRETELRNMQVNLGFAGKVSAKYIFKGPAGKYLAKPRTA
jgi:hypothetical protein